jgi:hypothetical protein
MTGREADPVYHDNPNTAVVLLLDSDAVSISETKTLRELIVSHFCQIIGKREENASCGTVRATDEGLAPPAAERQSQCESTRFPVRSLQSDAQAPSRPIVRTLPIVNPREPALAVEMATQRAPVQARGGGYGLDAELARKAAERYDYDAEDEAREWIEEISAMEIGGDFGAGLKDGVILCTLANKIHPGVVKRVETKSKMPFKLMENVSNFLKACRVMGVSEFDLFETVDLFELKDLGCVVRCIFSLGRAVQRNYPNFDGPTLGVKEAVKNERTFSKDKLAQARNAPSLVNLGSMRTMPRLELSHANNVTFGADAALNLHRPPPPPPPPSAEKVELVSRFRASSNWLQEQQQSSAAPSESPAPSRIEVEQAVAELSDAVETVVVTDSTVKSSLPGLNATVAVGQTPEEEAQQWIEDVINEKFLASFGDSLKDGVILCTLLNSIKPGLIPKIQTSHMPFKQMENITAFLKGCRVVGVAEFDLFETVDLFELKNVDLVVKCIHALGRAVQKNVPEYTGPALGVKESTVNKRTFSEAQLREARSAVPVLAHGSSTVMERGVFDRSASVTFGYDAAISGRTKSSSGASPAKPEPPVNASPKPSKKPAAVVEPPSAEPEAPVEAEKTSPFAKWASRDAAASSAQSSAAKRSVNMGSSSSALPTRTVWS